MHKRTYKISLLAGLGMLPSPQCFEPVGIIPVSRMYFGVTNLGLLLHPINYVTASNHYSISRSHASAELCQGSMWFDKLTTNGSCTLSFFTSHLS